VSTAVMAQTVVAGLMAAGLLVVFAARFSASNGWLGAAIATVTADHASKSVARLALGDGRSLELLGGRLGLTYELNPLQGFGSTFWGVLLVTAAIVVLAVVLYHGLSERGYRMAAGSSFACGLMAGGFSAIAFDRAFRGSVADLIWFGPHGAYLYNLADLAVFAALVLLVLRLLQLLPEAWRHRRIIWRELTNGAQEAS